jgi:hypothetical protein
MKVGDTVFLVPENYPRDVPIEAPVVYSGAQNFTAAGLTFKRAEGEPFIGTHWRYGTAWESREIFANHVKKRDTWDHIRYIANAATPPAHLSADDLDGILKLMKGKG